MNYSPILIDHFRNPRNVGMLRNPDGVGEEEYDGCGDLARVSLRVTDGRVTDVRFQTYGCGPTIAAASAGSELVRGGLLAGALNLTPEAVEEAVGGLPPERRHAAQVVVGAIRAAARDYLRRRDALKGAGAQQRV